MSGKKEWFVIDGYRPSPTPDPNAEYVGHESVMILNTNEVDAHLLLNVYFEDREPVENIPFTVPAKRIRSFRTDEFPGGVSLGVGVQYSIAIKSDVGVHVQYGRLDVQQPNMAYMALVAHGE